MENNQNSSNNQGTGVFGNNNNSQFLQGIENLQTQIGVVNNNVLSLITKINAIKIDDISEKIIKDLQTSITASEKTLLEKIKDLEKQIADLENKQKEVPPTPPKDKLCWIKKVPSWFWMLLAIIVGSIAFIRVMICFQEEHGFCIQESSTSTILAFVGIAATFVVVSNYAQTKDIQRDFDSKVKEVERKFDSKVSENKQEFETKIKLLNSENESKISSAKCNINLRISSSYSQIYTKNPNAIVEHLSYAAEDILDVVNNDGLFESFFRRIENELNDSTFKESNISTIEFFLTNFGRIKTIQYQEKRSFFFEKIKIILEEKKEALKYYSNFKTRLNSLLHDINIGSKSFINKAKNDLEIFIGDGLHHTWKYMEDFQKNDIEIILNNPNLNVLKRIYFLRNEIKKIQIE